MGLSLPPIKVYWLYQRSKFKPKIILQNFPIFYTENKNTFILILGANEAKNPLLESWGYVYRQLVCIGYTKDQT